MTMEPRKAVVRAGYDATAEAFEDARSAWGPERPWLERLLAEVEWGRRVLDLGCGNGAPIAAALVAAGLEVTGVDISPEQVRRARARLPGARFLVADMTDQRAVDFAPSHFAAAVAWDSVFHVPPEQQPALFHRVHTWLASGAPFALTLGASPGEIHTEHLGQPMYYGALDPAQALRALRVAGFAIEEHRIDDPSGGGHLVIWARC